MVEVPPRDVIVRDTSPSGMTSSSSALGSCDGFMLVVALGGGPLNLDSSTAGGESWDTRAPVYLAYAASGADASISLCSLTRGGSFLGGPTVILVRGEVA